MHLGAGMDDTTATDTTATDTTAAHQRSVRLRARMRGGAVAAALAAALVAACAPSTPPPDFVGAPASPHPVTAPPVPQNPYMATPASNLHADSYQSDSQPTGGPLGSAPVVRRGGLGKYCVPTTRDSVGHVISTCVSVPNYFLRVYDADLHVLGERFLGAGDLTGVLLTGQLPIGGGTYFYIDNQDRVVLADTANHFRVIRITDDGNGGVTFSDDVDLDMTPWLRRDCPTTANPHPAGVCESVTSILPDWVSGHYWAVTSAGRVFLVDPSTNSVSYVDLGEEIKNGFAVDESGAYIATTFAVYGLHESAGAPVLDWRQAYDRGSGQKPGQLSWGTGTTPTLLGSDLVVIGDNADPMNVVFMDRRPVPAGPRVKCTVPVFGAGASGNENSVVGIGDSVIAGNTYGYDAFSLTPLSKTLPGGVVRIDIAPDRSSCTTVWRSSTVWPSVLPRLSVANGLVYGYALVQGRQDWYVEALDFATGVSAWRKYVGTGPNADNQWGTLTLFDGGAYLGMGSGTLRITDGP